MIRLGLVLALSTLTLAGCKQGVGDRCQLTSDCQDNLICELPVGGTPQSGGVCEPNSPEDMGAVPPDLVAPPDLAGNVDAGPNHDAGTTLDLSVAHVDMAHVDLAGADL